jgi:heme/copper-type cytochrome/quinol oxidase subunit 2
LSKPKLDRSIAKKYTTMNFLKLITIFNWVVIAALAVFVAIATFSPSGKGGDAYGRGLVQMYFFIAIIALIVLLVLNLLPFKWAKYTAFALMLAFYFFPKIISVIGKIKQSVTAGIEATKPIFADKERERIARAIYNGDPETLKNLLKTTPTARLNENGELLSSTLAI